MPFIGNQPAESYASFERQVFTIVNSQTAYTLTHAVTNENDIRLVVNNVVQEPGSGKAYTASNTTLTLSAALVNGTDEMYCVYLGRALQTVNPPNASVGTSQLASSLDLSSKTITLASNMKNTPAFLAKPSSDQTSLSNNSDIKVLLGTEIFDTDNAFDSSRFTVPSGAAGKYFFYGQLRMQVDSDADLDNAYIYFYKNGSLLLQTRTDFGGNNIRSYTPTNAIVADLSVGDYMELYGAIQSSSARSFVAADTRFGGYKLIGV